MALMKCPECGKDVSTSAVSCPHCGYPIGKYVANLRAGHEKAVQNGIAAPARGMDAAEAAVAESCVENGRMESATENVQKKTATIEEIPHEIGGAIPEVLESKTPTCDSTPENSIKLPEKSTATENRNNPDKGEWTFSIVSVCILLGFLALFAFALSLREKENKTRVSATVSEARVETMYDKVRDESLGYFSTYTKDYDFVKVFRNAVAPSYVYGGMVYSKNYYYDESSVSGDSLICEAKDGETLTVTGITDAMINIKVGGKDYGCKKLDYETSLQFMIPAEGMSAEDCLKTAWGEPEKKNIHKGAYGTDEQWVYGNDRYVYIDNGTVTSVSYSA